MNNLLSKAFAEAAHDFARANGEPVSLDAIQANIETRLVAATWTLRRLPDREAGWIASKGSTIATVMDKEQDPDQAVYEARLRAPIRARDIDDMQPALDLLGLLPDIKDRQLVFWAAWHQEGELGERVPWGRVIRSLANYAPSNNYVTRSRWSLKRYYDNALHFLAHCVVNSQGANV